MSSFSNRSLPVYVTSNRGDIGDSASNSIGSTRVQRPALFMLEDHDTCHDSI
ncbi:MAG: hypothetical protein HFG16_01330 [Erysipelotrichaceae bacterium]|nr:hypothetical protein [Erysipelotrichaceae bacterium]